MANSQYGNVIYADTVGILSKTAVKIRAINFYPAAVADAIDLNFWDESNPLSGSSIATTATASSGTVTDDNAALNLLTAAAFPDGGVVKVISTNGLAANKTYHLIGTVGDNDRFIVTPTASWADEAGVIYQLITYPARSFYNRLTPTVTNTHQSNFVYFGESGIWLPNLVLETISTSAYAQIYLASR